MSSNMSSRKLETILSLIQVAEMNLKNAQNMLVQSISDRGGKVDLEAPVRTPGFKSKDEDVAVDVQEGHFDGENMVGDNGQIYPVPQNYASKTQLVVGDRMKWMLTEDREIFKLIQPATRQRVSGTFDIEGDNYLVLVDEFTNPVKILKASATYAMKNLGLEIGDEVAIFVPKDATPTWGAFISVVHSQESDNTSKVSVDTEGQDTQDDIALLKEFKISEEIDGKSASDIDFF